MFLAEGMNAINAKEGLILTLDNEEIISHKNKK